MSGWQDKERLAKEALEREFGIEFRKHVRIQVGEYPREVDLSSSDGQIIAQVKAGHDMEPNGRIKAYRFGEMCLDCIILMSIPAKRKIMFVGDPAMHEQFKREVKGFPFHDIEIRLV